MNAILDPAVSRFKALKDELRASDPEEEWQSAHLLAKLRTKPVRGLDKGLDESRRTQRLRIEVNMGCALDRKREAERFCIVQQFGQGRVMIGRDGSGHNLAWALAFTG